MVGGLLHPKNYAHMLWALLVTEGLIMQGSEGQTALTEKLKSEEQSSKAGEWVKDKIGDGACA